MIEKAKAYVHRYLRDEVTGHDYYHTLRVYRSALAIGEQEAADGNVDMEVIGLMALLHDIDDRKLSPQTYDTLARASKFLSENQVSRRKTEMILEGIRNLSFAGSGTSVPTSMEGKCVQDADRLDAIGAIGIARAFAFGGNRGRMIYDPDESNRECNHTIHHFYEKLLLLKDKMNTAAGQKMAQQRHDYMVAFLEQFYMEWDGQC